MGHEIYSNENEVEGVRIRVEYDDDAESPRTAWDNVTAFWSDGMHRRYNFHEAAADEVLARIKSAMPVPVDDVREVLAVLEPLADEVRDPHLAKLISMFKGAVR